MILIRNFKLEDLSEVTALVKETFDEYYKPETYMALMSAWNDGFIVAEDEGRIIGLLLATIPSPREARILIMAVEKNWRSRGLGTSMMNHFTAVCQRLGFNSIRLEVRESNMGAITFYNRFGFQIVGYLPCYYRNGEAGHIMQRILTS